MEFNLQSHVKSGKTLNEFYRAACEPVVCEDGFTVSIQASSSHYCSPRNMEGPYESFELGFPSAVDEIIKEFAENPNCPTETVYGYVPIMHVYALLYKHGGVIALKQRTK